MVRCVPIILVSFGLMGCRISAPQLETVPDSRPDRPSIDFSQVSCPDCGQGQLDPRLMTALQALQDHIEHPIRITSGYRCPTHNRKVGGVPASLHLEGKAVDLTAPGLSMEALAREAARIPAFRDGGIGVYPKRSYLHLDLRGHRARWGIRETLQPSTQPPPQRSRNMNDVWQVLLNNQGPILALVVTLLGLLKLTSWGRSNKMALDTVVSVIEQLNLGDAKKAVRKRTALIPKRAEAALLASVNKVDPKRRTDA